MEEVSNGRDNCHAISDDPFHDKIIEFVPEEFEEFGERFRAFSENDFDLGKHRISFFGVSCQISEEDNRSSLISQVGLFSLRFEICLKEGETIISGEEKLRRLKEEKPELIRLGEGAFLFFLLDYRTNKEDSILEWFWKNYQISRLDFFGTVLDQKGDRRVLCLYRSDDGRWHWDSCWLDDDWSADDLSVVLVKNLL